MRTGLLTALAGLLLAAGPASAQKAYNAWDNGGNRAAPGQYPAQGGWGYGQAPGYYQAPAANPWQVPPSGFPAPPSQAGQPTTAGTVPTPAATVPSELSPHQQQPVSSPVVSQPFSVAPQVPAGMPLQSEQHTPIATEVMYPDACDESEKRSEGWKELPFNYHLYGSIDALAWWIRPGSLPPLVTTGSAADLTPGALGQPGTRVLTEDRADEETQYGGRVTLGVFSHEQHFGIEGSFLFLEEQTSEFTATSPGTPILARPFFDATRNAESAVLVAFPGQSSGSVGYSLTTELRGIQANALGSLWRSECVRIHLLVGYRYLELSEDLRINQDTTVGGPAATGAQTTSLDQFSTHNAFHGGQIGLDGEVLCGRFFLSGRWTAAFGESHQVVGVLGRTTATLPGGPPIQMPTGPLTLPTNIGERTLDSFAIVAEVGVNVGFRFTDCLSARVGYTYLMCSDVVRPGDQIDRVVNTNQVPTLVGAARPAPIIDSTAFWAHGFNLGVEVRY